MADETVPESAPADAVPPDPTVEFPPKKSDRRIKWMGRRKRRKQQLRVRNRVDREVLGADNLTLKQRLFVEHYLSDCVGNAPKAAKAAAYEHCDHRSVFKILSDPNVASAIERRMAKAHLTPSYVIDRLNALAGSDIANVMEMDEDGEWRPSLDKAFENGATGQIKKVKIKKFAATESLPARTEYELEMYDANIALSTLAKCHGLLEDKIRITGNVGADMDIRHLMVKVLADPTAAEAARSLNEFLTTDQIERLPPSVESQPVLPALPDGQPVATDAGSEQEADATAS